MAVDVGGSLVDVAVGGLVGSGVPPGWVGSKVGVGVVVGRGVGVIVGVGVGVGVGVVWICVCAYWK